MKVILLGEVKGKGGEGDVVDVNRGFAVNYLFRNKLAIEATRGNLKQLEARRHNIEKRELARTTDANTLKEALEGKVVTVAAKVGDEGQLFGSVTTSQISEAISEQIGPQIERRKIDVSKSIKSVGDHEAFVSLYRDIRATVTVRVVDADAKPEDLADEPAQAEGEQGEGIADDQVEAAEGIEAADGMELADAEDLAGDIELADEAEDAVAEAETEVAVADDAQDDEQAESDVVENEGEESAEV